MNLHDFSCLLPSEGFVSSDVLHNHSLPQFERDEVPCVLVVALLEVTLASGHPQLPVVVQLRPAGVTWPLRQAVFDGSAVDYLCW